MRIMLIEDEQHMAEALMALLRSEGYEVLHFADGSRGEEAALTESYDLLILDLMLPGRNGYQIAQSIRREGNAVPILMLTAKSSVEDKIQGLDDGADDYLTKPFESGELLARVRALLRRSGGSAFENGKKMSSAAGLIFLSNSASVRNEESGEEIRLQGKEYQLLEYLLENRESILSKEQLALRIWGFESEAEYNNVEVYISFIRKKLRYIHAKAEIKTYRGIGYRLEEKQNT